MRCCSREGRLPLNIFEPRYLALIEDALAGDRMFGMIQPSEEPGEGSAEGGAADDDDAPADDGQPGLFAVGCIGRIMSFNEREDGTCSIALAGIARYRVGCELDGVRGYRRLSVSYFGYAHDLEDVEAIDFDREALVGTLRRYFAHRGFEARWEAIESRWTTRRC